MGFIQEFREFAVKGNAMDMAVGIIIGAAFNKIVQSIVNDLVMPPIGLFLGRMEFPDLKLTLQHPQPAVTDAAGDIITPAVAEVAIRYGQFINIVIEFMIVAVTVFMVVKLMNRIIRQREAEAAAR